MLKTYAILGKNICLFMVTKGELQLLASNCHHTLAKYS